MSPKEVYSICFALSHRNSYFRASTLAVVLTWFSGGLGFLLDCRADENQEQITPQTIIDGAPEADGRTYRCEDMVRVVNYLRGLGKNGAIAALKQHVAALRQHRAKGSDARVFMICRCLFQNAKGWKEPVLGQPEPDVPEKATKAYPAFPIAFSKDVPFLVIAGYALGGLAEQPEGCVKECESLPLIENDLPTNGFAAAAQTLVASEAFKALYPNDKTRQEMTDIIVGQAGAKGEKASGGRKERIKGGA
jgi:hypothetical protein